MYNQEKTCLKCGQPLDNAKFCPNCGEKIESKATGPIRENQANIDIDQVQFAQSPQFSSVLPPKTWHKAVKVIIVIFIALCFIGVLTTIGSSPVEKDAKVVNSDNSTLASDKQVPSDTNAQVDEDTNSKVSQETEKIPQPDKNLTLSQKNALKQAQDYIDYAAFSRSGLIEQLKFEGYSTEDSTYAVDNCGADWNEQAALLAQSYLDSSAFSRSGLIEQLEFEGFTSEQAKYGVTSVGY